MSKRNYTHGTPEQMLAAFQNKISELGGDVEACNNVVTSASFIDTDGAFGEPGATITEHEIRDYWEREHLNDPTLVEYGEDGFDDWYTDTKEWLTPVKAADEYATDFEAEAAAMREGNDDPEVQAFINYERFIHTLIGDVNDALEANSGLDSWSWVEEEDDLVLTTIAGDAINEYSIPKSDLTLDWDRISEDVDYILNEVQSFEDDEVFDDVDDEDVYSSTEVVADSHWDDLACQLIDELNHVNIALDDKPAVLDELINNFGYTEEEAEGLFTRINECNAELSGEGAESITSSVDELDDDIQYEMIRTKQVPDSDGFMTDYTMYYDTENDRYVFMFGDNEVYTPEEGWFDWECETEEEANGWFDSYEGFAEDEDEDEDIYSTQNITASEENIENWFNDSFFDVISAGWTTSGEVIVILNNNAPDLEEAASDLTRCIQNNNYHVIDWNVNGSNVFIFEVIHNNDYAALAESDGYFTSGEDLIHSSEAVLGGSKDAIRDAIAELFDDYGFQNPESVAIGTANAVEAALGELANKLKRAAKKNPDIWANVSNALANLPKAYLAKKPGLRAMLNTLLQIVESCEGLGVNTSELRDLYSKVDSLERGSKDAQKIAKLINKVAVDPMVKAIRNAYQEHYETW